MRIRNEKDFWSGVLFLLFGLGFALGAQNYDMGTAQRMGPAYFPTLLGGLLAFMGLYIASRGLRDKFAGVDSKIDPFHWRPLLLVLGAVLLFALLLRPLGLVVALTVMIALGSVGGPDFKAKEVVVIAAALVLLVLGVFIWGLKLTIPVWPAFIDR